MKVEHFVLKDSGLHYVKDMPEKPTGVFRTEEILVANQEEVRKAIIEIQRKGGAGMVSIELGEIYPLECEVKIKVDCTQRGCIGECGECEHLNKVAFVKLKEETKNKKVLVVGSNKIHLSQTIKTALGQDAGTKEEESEEDIAVALTGMSSPLSYPEALKLARYIKRKFLITKRQ